MFESIYPTIAHFAKNIGWIEIGYDEDSPLTSFIRAIEPGGMAWEGADTYASMDEAFQDMEAGLKEWMREIGLE